MLKHRTTIEKKMTLKFCKKMKPKWCRNVVKKSDKNNVKMTVIKNATKII